MDDRDDDGDRSGARAGDARPPSRRQVGAGLGAVGLTLAGATIAGPVDARPPAEPTDILPPAAGPFRADWSSLVAQYRVPAWFRDAKFGIFAHWGPQSQPGRGDWYARRMYEQGHPSSDYHRRTYGHPSRVGFKDVVRGWTAARWDPDALIDRYVRAGARYLVSLAAHHDTFALYQSDLQPWNALRMGPKRDIVGDWQRAARARGLRFGVSDHSAPSWNWFYGARASDTTGALAGVPYDGVQTRADGRGQWWQGLDPQDLYPPAHPPGPRISGNPQNPAYVRRWYMRNRELIARYDLDLFYHDYAGLPFGPAGLALAAHFYNQARRRRGNRDDVVMTAKFLPPEHRAGMVDDIERGGSDQLRAAPWQTDTCIGDWFYSDAVREARRYKSPRQVLTMLADIVAKNGNLLLSIPIRGDGTLDEQEIAFLDALAGWMPAHGEAIFGTRPWSVFGEGPTTIRAGDQNERDVAYVPEDIRFTAKGDAIYAFLLGGVRGHEATISSLRPSAGLLACRIASVDLLGGGPVQWVLDGQGLKVAMPAERGLLDVLRVRLAPA